MANLNQILCYQQLMEWAQTKKGVNITYDSVTKTFTFDLGHGPKGIFTATSLDTAITTGKASPDA
jgi:hypothetical protein